MFLESLEPGVQIGVIPDPIRAHQDAQEHQEEDFGGERLIDEVSFSLIEEFQTVFKSSTSG